jgi:carbamoyl-phosphate synthase large subunit
MPAEITVNVLVTSAGRRVKIVDYFRRTLRGAGLVMAVDCDQTAPALHAADRYQLVPRIEHPDYVESLLNICRMHRIAAIVPLLDPELSLLSAARELFRGVGTQVVVSPSVVVETTLDKQATHDFLVRHALPCIPTYGDPDAVRERLAVGSLRFPLFVKPRRGSASIGVNRVEDAMQLDLACGSADVVIQPYMEGPEYGVDAYVDLLTKEVVSVFLKRKLLMRAGETERSVSVQDAAMTELVIEVLSVFGALGPIDVDCFREGDKYLVGEVNPRFGGGYPHAYESGENFMQLLVNNIRGAANPPKIGNYQVGTVMAKWDEVYIW